MKSRVKYERRYTENRSADAYKALQTLLSKKNPLMYDIVPGWIDEQVFKGTPRAVNRLTRWIAQILSEGWLPSQDVFDALWREKIEKYKSKEVQVIAYLIKAAQIF